MGASAAAPRDDLLSDTRVRQVNVVIGSRELDDPAWGPLDDATAIGVDFTETVGSPWLFLEGGVHYASDETSFTGAGGERLRADLDLYEFSAGVLAEWPVGAWVRPYVGGGGALVHGEAEIEDNGEPSDDDAVLGAYWKVGILVRVLPDAHVGVELRGLDGGTLSTELTDAEVDSTQLSLVLGASF